MSEQPTTLKEQNLIGFCQYLGTDPNIKKYLLQKVKVDECLSINNKGKIDLLPYREGKWLEETISFPDEKRAREFCKKKRCRYY